MCDIHFMLLYSFEQKKFKMSKKGDSGRRKSKSKEQSKNDDTEDSWVFDSLVGFLRGPVWCVPVMTFIEQKSLGNDFSYCDEYT